VQNIRNKFNNILVSGASGDIGIGIGRILKASGFNKVFGCDINTDSWGLCIFENIAEVPRADSAGYIEKLIGLIAAYKIDLFIPSSEAEIKALIDTNNISEAELGCQILMADQSTIKISLDKYDTSVFLKEHNLNSPWTVVAGQGWPKSLPCIFKPRSGQGSKGLEIVKESERVRELSNKEGYIFQELLSPDEEEYTCGVYRSKRGEIRAILIKRTLNGGFTGKGTVVENKDIEDYVNEIAEALNVVGAINLQLRLTDHGPFLFEINPRLSSTVVFRHKLGFEDLLWALEELAGLPLRTYNKPKEGTQFYRGLSEYFIK